MSTFTSAHPVWLQGKGEDKNLFVGFRTVFDTPDNQEARSLRITGSSCYRIWMNGHFVGHGPARAAHGFYRVDEWPLDHCTRDGANLLAVEVAGYNVNSYYLLDQPPFLQAEVVWGDLVLAWTGGAESSFEALLLEERVQKVQRYSYQRPFVEVYRLSPRDTLWRTDAEACISAHPCETLPDRKLLARGVPYPQFAQIRLLAVGSHGTFTTGEPLHVWRDRSLTGVGPLLGGFPEDELEVTLSYELQRFQFKTITSPPCTLSVSTDVHLDRDSWQILDFGVNLTGFIGVEVVCKEPVTLYLVFDEILLNGDVEFNRLDCVNAVCWHLDPGTVALESFEPYTLRYLKVIAHGGSVELGNIYLRELANPHGYEANFSCSDPALNRIFEAGRETFRQNALDILMDCPSRERAGWLCDSFFTARVEGDLTGANCIERSFLENFLLPEAFPHLPAGMLPMCYPADHNGGSFIPNWALWFVLELAEYKARSGDRELTDDLKPRVLELFDYFEQYRNADGLLEGLDGWIFVEWSEANKFVQDVNYPTNMLYCAALEVAGDMYNRGDFCEQAARLKKVILDQAFDGEFFVDNSVREDGRLTPTRNRTEVCQYYAFYFGIASAAKQPELWRRLITEFGPLGKQRDLYPDLHPANTFPGYYLRLEILSRAGLRTQIVDEMKQLFLPMAELTGTLWEHKDPRASCSHGFASHVVHILYRDVLGCSIDADNKVLRLDQSGLPVDWCNGVLPVRGDHVTVNLHTHDGDTKVAVSGLPKDFELEIQERESV